VTTTFVGQATPRRIQQRRTPGWRKPDGAISVARPHKWGNPFAIGVYARDAAEAVEMYRQWLPSQPLYLEVSELAGHDLICFCPLDQPCHADVLLELANP
jgi:hypothetical protein